jgi:hypothetical protein
VEWLKEKNGIYFNDLGIVYGPLDYQNFGENPLFVKNRSFSIELLLSPDSDDYKNFSYIFGLYDEHFQEIFSISQLKSLLNISKYRNTLKKKSGHNWRWLNNAFSKGQIRFIAITSDKTSTTVYLDGKKARKYRNFSMALGKELTPTWRMVIGNDPTGKKPWTGKIYGVAIYSKTLSPEQVRGNYEKWEAEFVTSLLKEKDALALYPINEQKGTVIHNSMSDKYHLSIPSKFKILKKKFLQSDGIASKLDGPGLRDMRINMLGFIPLGWFSFLVFNSYIRPSNTPPWRPMLFVVIGGTGLSLMVEILQAFLPMRNSSLTDVIFNSFGTILGVILAVMLISLKKLFSKVPTD